MVDLTEPHQVEPQVMPAQAEFEEKTYEGYFCSELARVTKLSFPPGQRAEAYLGFDVAYSVPWQDIPWPHSPFWPIARIEEYGFSLHDLTHVLQERYARLPDVKFNLFIQFKRPERIVGHRGAEWFYWNEPYYRYDIMAHQQRLLSALDAESGNRATVIYASPAYIEFAMLFDFARQDRTIAESNIAPVARLQNHSRYTYVEPGSRGMACTEPEDIEGPSFNEIMGAAGGSEPQSFVEHLLWTSKTIRREFEGGSGR